MRWILAFPIVLVCFVAHADIYQWQYVNPSDPTQGIKQGTILAPDGLGVDVLPGANLANLDLNRGYLVGATLSQANLEFTFLWEAVLNNADLSHADLSYSYLAGADLTGANLAGANIERTIFDIYASKGSGISLAQLYSTASYQAKNLTGVSVYLNDFSGADLSGQNLTEATLDGAYLYGTDLSNANLTRARLVAGLTGANFSHANLTNAYVQGDLTNVNFDGALIEGIVLSRSLKPGLTAAQLYSTGSYKNGNLSGIDLSGYDLQGWNFDGENLTNAHFETFLYPYVGRAKLQNTSFRRANLTGASFFGAIGLDTVDFTDAIIKGANLARHGGEVAQFSAAQIYSTASFKAHDLVGINFAERFLNNWNLAGQNLTNGYFAQANTTGTDFTGADLRGTQYLQLDSATTVNTILPDGHIHGLTLAFGSLLTVRNYSGDPGRLNYLNEPAPLEPIPIQIDQQLKVDPNGNLQIIFDQDTWHSTISFAAAIPVSLDGSLDLQFVDGVDANAQVGRTFNLFDWTGVNPTGRFSINSPYQWELSQLYTTGEVTLVAVPEPASICLLAIGIVALLFFGFEWLGSGASGLRNYSETAPAKHQTRHRIQFTDATHYCR